MSLSKTGGCVLLFFLTSIAATAGAQNQPPDGFSALFNGRDLSGWHGERTMSPLKLAEMEAQARNELLATDQQNMLQHWRVEGGEIVNDGHGVYLTSDQHFGDIELLLEYKTVAKADSGIYLRGTPQVQIWDTTKEGGKWDNGADKGSGGLYNNKGPGRDPLVLADKPFGEWNSFRILQVGARTTVYLNDKLVVDHATMDNYWDRDRPLIPKGPIQLQTHGGEIRWRNVFIREIPPDEANQILASRRGEGFLPVFNGKDLNGWAGAVDSYEVQDGSIVCKAGKGGTLYTADQYADFAASMLFQLPPGGNNGLAIRYPGSGDPAYAGMCELQVLDNDHPKYAKLDPRQFHGSAYGMVASHRGYLRETGEWNYQEVRVQGSRVTVELNGYVILDTDLSQVTEYMGGRPHPGKDAPQGHFGFAGHSDPVRFRDVAMKRLDAATTAAKR